MNIISNAIQNGTKNFVFVGEAGSGKSEISINFAKMLAKQKDKEVHLFDLDMTKPLFRTRDFENELKHTGVICHFEAQFMDAPTSVGWVQKLLKDPKTYVVLDVGGDYIGARAIGRYSSIINKEDTLIFFVINSFRVWSTDIERINTTFSQIMGVSHIDTDKVKIISNPNIGIETTKNDFLTGTENTKKLLSKYADIYFSCAKKEIYLELCEDLQNNIFPLEMHIAYP